MNLTNEELIRHMLNQEHPTDAEAVLVVRLRDALDEIDELERNLRSSTGNFSEPD